MLHLIAQREAKKFCKDNNIYGIPVIFNLLKVHYFINTKNSCWTRDISCSLKSGKYIKVEVGMHFLKNGRYVNEVETDKLLGKRWELTNKGIYLLDRYAAWLREEQRNLDYKIKLTHKKSREMKKNS